MYRITRTSPHGIVKVIATFFSFEEALEYCLSKDWIYTDISGSEWLLEIEEIF